MCLAEMVNKSCTRDRYLWLTGRWICNLLTSIPHDAARGVYGSIDEVEADIRLIASNCKAYNAPGTIFHQAADQAGPDAILCVSRFNFLMRSPHP